VVIEQIRIGHDNFSYVIYCPINKKAAIVDPGLDSTRTLRFIASKKLTLEYILITHHHSDHSADSKRIKSLFPQAKIVTSEEDGKKLAMKPDIVVSD
jgi:hydroxyacylglutathione hydrolase